MTTKLIVGPRGGVYHIDKNNNKIYHPKQRDGNTRKGTKKKSKTSLKKKKSKKSLETVKDVKRPFEIRQNRFEYILAATGDYKTTKFLESEWSHGDPDELIKIHATEGSIHGFYAKHVENYKDVLPWERKMLSGLGSVLLCLLIQDWDIKTIVRLDASGGLPWVKEQNYKHIMETMTESQIEDTLQSSPEERKMYMKYKDEFLTKEEKATALSDYIANKKLIKFYERFGFQLTGKSQDYWGSEMTASVKTLRTHCSASMFSPDKLNTLLKTFKFI